MITSTSNAQVKELIKFRKKSKARDTAGVFLVEGPRMAAELPRERIVKLYFSESYVGKDKAARETGGSYPWKGVPSEILSDSVFAYVSDTKTPQGVLAVVRRLEYTLSDILGGTEGHPALSGAPAAGRDRDVRARETDAGARRAAPYVIVLDNLQDPGNLGTIFRTAEAAGATGIVLGRDCVDVYNPKVIRSTMGAVFRLPFLYVDDLAGAIGRIKSAGVTVYAAHLAGKNTYDKEDYRGGCAFLIGNEGNGLKEEIAECADCRIKIPMAGGAESLNAAVAAAVLMFEAGRQRRNMAAEKYGPGL